MAINAGIFSRSGQLYTGGPQDGFLQSIHPAARFAALFLLVLAVSLCMHGPLLFVVFAATMVGAFASYLDISSIYRVALVPLLIFALPAWVVAHFWYGGAGGNGGLFFLRTTTSVIVVTAMLHSIGMRQTGNVLRWFGLPVELRQMWSIMLSQVASFSEMVSNMAIAREARYIRRSAGQMRKQIGTQAGVLFARTHRRGGQLAFAMESRTLHSTSVTLSRKDPWRANDYVFLVGIVIVSGLIVM
jgi:energy-coupling factor transporter transmembrane protein EcfT